MSIKSLLATTAAIGLIGGAAYAEGDKDRTQQEAQYEQTEQYGQTAAGAEDAQYIGQAVYDSSGEQVGTIDQIATSDTGEQEAVISVGAYLGLGEKRVSVPTSELSEVAEGSGYTLAMTADELRDRPDYQDESATDDAWQDPQ